MINLKIKWLRFRRWFVEVLGVLLFILWVMLLSPVLFITGGIMRILRYIDYVRNQVNDKEVKKYYW